MKFFRVATCLFIVVVLGLVVAATALKKVSLIDQSKCIKCGTCFKNCPVKAISKIEKDGKVVQYLIDPKKCIACGVCIKNCPVKTIHVAQYDAKAGKMVELVVAKKDDSGKEAARDSSSAKKPGSEPAAAVDSVKKK